MSDTAIQERECERCHELIPSGWRHYQPMCRCVWEHHLSKTPPPRPPWAPTPYEPATYYCEPDPECLTCHGYGQVPCIPQDLSTLRVTGVCETCGAPASYLTRDDSGNGTGSYQPVPDSARHHTDTDHPAIVVAGSLIKVLENHLEEATQ